MLWNGSAVSLSFIPYKLFLYRRFLTKNFNIGWGHATHEAMVANLWLFLYVISFWNAECQTRKQHVPPTLTVDALSMTPPSRVAMVYFYLRHWRWVEVMFSPLFVCLSVCLSLSRISQKVMGRFRWNLVDRLRVWQGRIDSILVEVRIQIWPIGWTQNINCSAWWRYARY